MTDDLHLAVRGRPAPQGSKKPIIMRNGRAGLIDEPTLGLTSWRQAVHDAGIAELRRLCGCGDPQCTAMPPGFPIAVPVRASMTFLFSRPKAHYGSGRNAQRLKNSASAWPTTTVGDLSKLARSTEDAMQSAGVLADDGLIQGFDRLEKLWVDEHRELLPVEGALITLSAAVAAAVHRPNLYDVMSTAAAGSPFGDEGTLFGGVGL